MALRDPFWPHAIKHMASLFHDGGPYHIETNPLICSANQGCDFYVIGTFIMKELNTSIEPHKSSIQLCLLVIQTCVYLTKKT